MASSGKTQRQLFNDLISSGRCESCPSTRTVTYTYVTRNGTESRKTHCVDHKQPEHIAQANRQNARRIAA